MINTIKDIIIKGILVSILFATLFSVVDVILIPILQKNATETLVNSINNTITQL